MVAENRKGLSIVVLLNVLLNFGNIHEATGASIRNNAENGTISMEPQTRVYNGRVARARGEPFIVYIVKRSRDLNSYDFCAGSILDEEHILTAAHCIASDPDAVDQRRVFVWAEPEDDISQVNGFPATPPTTGQYIRVKEAQWPRNYKSPQKHDNDIAVYILSRRLNLIRGRVETICIYTNNNWENRPVILGGWGTYNCVNKNKFHGATGTTMFNSECGTAYRQLTKEKVTITPNQICARLKGQNNQLAEQASGDSGGPLFTVEHGYPQQIGVVNFDAPASNGCADGNFPGVYARTSQYISFIESTGVPLRKFTC